MRLTPVSALQSLVGKSHRRRLKDTRAPKWLQFTGRQVNYLSSVSGKPSRRHKNWILQWAVCGFRILLVTSTALHAEWHCTWCVCLSFPFVRCHEKSELENRPFFPSWCPGFTEWIWTDFMERKRLLVTNRNVLESGRQQPIGIS